MNERAWWAIGGTLFGAVVTYLAVGMWIEHVIMAEARLPRLVNRR